MSINHVLLGLLVAGERHGYDLKREHDQVFAGAKSLAFGQVYATLERLQKKMQVEAVEVERVDGPDRTLFRITTDGRAELDQWLGRVEEPAPHVSNPLSAKATIALLVGDGDQAARYLSDQRAAHLARMRHYTQIKTAQTVTLPEVLAADYALFHLDADLQWLDLALDRITALDTAIAASTATSQK
ncbi:MAG: PadR family transcriptional regulator [Actinomycetia bacterium]|nr:PadR family transcriptional regulator [Actinomycetes bacterium]